MSDMLEFSSYQFETNEEFCLKAGAKYPQKILLIPPLFDEMNRTRRMLCDVMRSLTEREIGSLLPDMPGSNESLYPADQADLSIWKSAIAACLAQHANCSHIAVFRGGALLLPDGPQYHHWQLAPVKGRNLLRTMMRTRIASDKESGLTTTMADLEKQAEADAILLAGNLLNSKMVSELQQSEPVQSDNIRLARLENDSQSADVKLAGSPLWLRAEPDDDPQLSAAIAADLANWVQNA